MRQKRLLSRGWVVIATVAAMCCTAGLSSAIAEKQTEDKPGKKLVYQQQKDVVYEDRDGVAADVAMDIFTPTGPKNGIGIIDVASGAWHADRTKIRDHMRAQVYDIFCGKGYTVFAVRPGSITKFSALEMIDHLRQATKWVQEHAAQFGIDPENLGITGGSAGGHLTSLLVVSTPAGKDGKVDQPFKAVGIFFPPTDFIHYRSKRATDFGKDEKSAERIRALGAPHGKPGDTPLSGEQLTELARKISPTLLVDRKQPPFLIIHGDADPLVPLRQSEILVEALKKQGGSAELIVKKGGAHPWFTINEEVKVMADWFDTQLKPKAKS
jgi:acetyl esterase/lipase